MDKDIKEDDWVAWKWGFGIAEGQVRKIVPDRVEITSKNKKIARNGTQDNPAVIIDHKGGNRVLKLVSELEILKQ